MDISNIVNNSLQSFIYLLSEKSRINHTELKNYLTNKNQCLYKSRGKQCNSIGTINGYCSVHQLSINKHITMLTSKTTAIKNEKKAQSIKTAKEKLDQLLNTAISQEKTILKRTSKGYYDSNSELLFNNDFIVIGRLEQNNIVKLVDDDIEKCEQMGWEYLDSII
jgi:hypothetical protein